MAFPSGGYADAAAALADGMLHYWPMDEESGTEVADLVGDLVGDSRTGGYAQTNSIQPGKFRNGRKCADDLTELGSAGILVFDSEAAGTGELAAFSVSIWVKPLYVSFFTNYAVFGDPWSIGQVAFGCDNSGKVWLQYGDEGELYFESAGGLLVADTWQYIAVTYDGATIKMYLDSVEIYSAATAGTRLRHRYKKSVLGASPASNTAGVGSGAWATIDDAGIWDRALSSAEVDSIWNAGAGVELVVYSAPTTLITIDASLDGVDSEMRLWSDWSVLVDPITTRIFYRAELTGAGDSLDDLKLAISSWQATIQSGRADYLQAVVPASPDIVSAINARPNGQIVIYRSALFAGGAVLEQEMARVPMGQFVLNRGPRNSTMTLSGYAYGTAHQIVQARTLTGVRSESVDGAGARVRADIDWRLRPGMQAIAGERTLDVSYINFYATGGQAYMDVGERNG